MTLALLRLYQGRLDEARELLGAVLDGAETRGNIPSCVEVGFRLAQMDSRAGEWTQATARWAATSELAEQIGIDYALTDARWWRAVDDAHRGNLDAAQAAAEQGVRDAERTGSENARAVNLGVLGFIQLSVGDPHAADKFLRLVLDWLDHHRLSYATFPHAADAVEARLGVGALDEARLHLARLEHDAAAIESRWQFALARRLRGQLAAADGDLELAVAELERAAVEQQERRWPFEHARTLLALGQTKRRAKEKRSARDSLDAAAAAFEQLGAVRWAERARRELTRIGGRPQTAAALTATDSR